MDKAESIADWQRMYNGLTDPDEVEKNKQKAERQKRIEEKKADTGAYVV